MVSNKALALVAISAFAEQALAFNSHRHLHQQLDKRSLIIDWVTVYETVYFTPGQDSVLEATPVVANIPVNSIPTVTSTVTSTAAPIPAKPTVQAAPPPVKVAAPQTTLTKAVKPVVKETPKPAAAKPVAAVQAPSSSASSSSGSSSSGSSSGSPFAGKRGIAYNDPTLANTFGDGCDTCGWSYNWGSASDGIQSKFSYVPMLHGDTPDFTGYWDQNAEQCLADGSKALFSFNEPDIAAQANLSPAQAAASHVKYMNKYAGKALIGAPSVSNSGSAGQGIDWLNSFVSACSTQGEACHYDFCNVHWYSPASAADTLFEHLEAAHKACGGKPVWLTEFAPSGSADEINQFMKDVIPKLDNLDYLHAYSYFMVSTDSLMGGDGALSAIGSVYASL